MAFLANYANSKRNKVKSIFEGVSQTIIKSDGYEWTLPLFYYGNRALAGLYLIRTSKIKERVPDVRLKPMTIVPGLSVAVIINFEFDTSIGPVNEFYVGIPTKVSGKLPFGLAALQELFEGYMPVWCAHLPVSTDIAYKFGIKTWTFPKTLADIPFVDQGDKVCSEVIYDGVPAVRSTGSKKPGKLNWKLTIKNMLWQEGTLQTADHVFDMKNFSISVPGDAKIEILSNNPLAADLDDILLFKKAVASVYIPNLQALLFEPDRTPPHLLRDLDV